MEYDPGHLHLIRATYFCQSLARMGHQLSKLNDIPVISPHVLKIVTRYFCEF